MDWKKLLHKLLFPGAAVVLLNIPVGFGLLAYSFLVAGEDSPIAYVSYVISAYSLTVVCANAVPLFQKGSQWVQGLPLLSQLLEDVPYRARLMLVVSLVVNSLYAGFNALSGLYYHSPWFGTLAAYYLLLSVLRFLLARFAHRHGFAGNKTAQWKRYRLCGAMLIPMNFALAGVVVLTLKQQGGFHYGSMLIYIMALYAFYVTISGVVSLVRTRKYKSPVLSAARVVSLAAALVSMLSLEVAMLAQFGGGEFFRRAMIASTGGAVCFVLVGMASFMIVRATQELKHSPS